MELEDYLKTLDYKDVDENFKVKPGMAIIDKEGNYYLVGELITDDYSVIDQGCGCCRGTYYPQKYAWTIKELCAK